MNTAPLDRTFAALADPTRRAILTRLARGEATVMELVAPFDISQPAISRHLKVLEEAGLIHRGKEGKTRPCRIETRPLEEITGWLENYRRLLEHNYRSLDVLLKKMQSNEFPQTHARTKKKKKKRSKLK